MHKQINMNGKSRDICQKCGRRIPDIVEKPVGRFCSTNCLLMWKYKYDVVTQPVNGGQVAYPITRNTMRITRGQ